MKDLIEYIAKALVDAPDAVEVSEFGDEEASIIKLKVQKEDLGKVIGKKRLGEQCRHTTMVERG